MKYIASLVIVLIGLASIGVPGVRAANVGFVEVNGMQFEVNGGTHCYVGASFFNAMTLGADAGTRAQLDAAFAGLQALGGTNVRIWASSITV